MVALPVAPTAHARLMTPIWLSTPHATWESSTGPPLLRRSRRQPFIERMRSYSSPLRQSNRGTLAPVYQTASIIRLSSSADEGAKATATAKCSTSTAGSTGLLPTTLKPAATASGPVLALAAITAAGASASWRSAISAGMKSLLGLWSLRTVGSCGPRRKLGGRLHWRFRLGIPRRRLSAAGGLLDALVVHVAGIAVEDDVVLVEQLVDPLDFEQLLFRIVAVLRDGLGQRQRPGADLLKFRHRILQRIDGLEFRRRPLDAVVRLGQPPDQHQGVDEPAPGRAAIYRDQGQPPKRLDGVAEAQHPRPIGRIVDVGKVPGEQFIWHVHARADALQFRHQILAVPAGRRRRVELDILARLQILDHAGIHPLQRVPGFRVGGLRADGQTARTLGARHDPREARLRL